MFAKTWLLESIPPCYLGNEVNEPFTRLLRNGNE